MPYDARQPALLDLTNIVRENPKNVVFVTGAGASKFSGLPLWVELRRALCSDINMNADSVAVGRIAGLQMSQEALAEADLWKAFSKIKVALEPHFSDCIRKHLRAPAHGTNPVYDRIWRLNSKGIVSFNIDRLPLDSYAGFHHRALDFATGFDIQRIAPHLQTVNDFLFLPHGVIADPKTWAFDSERRDEVMNKQEVKTFLQAILIARHVVVVGFNASDAAFYSHVAATLAPFSHSGVNHFIICEGKMISSIPDLARNGFRPIIYTPAVVSDHREVLDILDSLISFVPSDSPVTPASPARTTTRMLDNQLVVADVEEQRRTLTAQVSNAVRDNARSEDDQVRGIKAVYDVYPRSMQSAWIIDPENDEFCRLFGRRIIRQIGDGAFGTVFLAEREDGTREAVKVLLQAVNRDPKYLLSFLRGISSMRILNQRHVLGMVEVHDAYEIPTCVFMEYVDGTTLETFVLSKRVETLPEALEILARIGAIVEAGHRLEERVLHRDLKPRNVMIRRNPENGEWNDVVVLDFDLSWHQGASHESVFHGKRAEGYAAPEQTALAPVPGVSTRHVGVDVFGLGMLMFFVFCRRDPRAGEQNFPDFRGQIQTALANLPGSSWRSVVPYLANLVCLCAQDDQRLRPGFSDVVADIKRVLGVIKSDRCALTDPILLEEIALCLNATSIERKDFGRRLIVRYAERTVDLSIVTYGGAPQIEVTVQRLAGEYDERAKSKYVGGRAERAARKLKRAGFVIPETREGSEGSLLRATFQKPSLGRRDAETIGGAIRSAFAALELA